MDNTNKLWICKRCTYHFGSRKKDSDPKRCSACGSKDFELFNIHNDKGKIIYRNLKYKHNI